MVCNLSFVVKNGVLKVTGSHLHFKSGSVLKMVLNKDVETTVHKQEVIWPFNSSNCDDLAKVIHQLQAFLYTDKCVTWSLCHSRASCLDMHYRLLTAYSTIVLSVWSGCVVLIIN